MYTLYIYNYIYGYMHIYTLTVDSAFQPRTWWVCWIAARGMPRWRAAAIFHGWCAMWGTKQTIF